MIALFEKDATDFAANGLGILEPAKCEVYEALNGAYELTLSHPYDERGKWRRLTTQRIVRARVPAAPTPAVSAPEAPGQALSVYRVDTPSGRRLHLRAKPSTAAKILESYKPGAEVTRLADVGDWLRVSVPSGASGYMWKDYLSHVRDEAGDPSGQAAGLPSRPARDQPFRIYKIEPGESEVKVYARHIFFDLSDNLALSVAADEATGAQALKMILESAQAAHEFTGYSDLTEHAASAQWALKSISECLLGAGGLIETWGGELFRDWYDVYAVKRLGAARGVTIRRGKNLTKLAGYLDDTGLTTRILPVGQDERGKMLYLPELYVDSPHLLEYPHPKLCALRVADAKVGGKVTKEKAYARMRRAAQAQFDLGVDRTRASLDAAFVDLSATDLYQGTELADLQSVFLGDSVTLIDEATGMNASLRVCEYTYDALAGRYESISLGAALKGSECQMISPRQIPAGAIGGTMISPGAVDGGALKDGAVDTLHIRDAAITNALIANAAIGTAQIADAAITNAKIDRLAVADANIQDATITAAKIASATITSAQIADAAIGTAQIALGAITTALIEQGAVGTAQIANASITDGKIVELTANKINAGTLSVERLIIAGNTKSIVFAINEFNDTPHLSYNTIDGGALTRRSITADRIVAGAITADEIAASTILAGNIAAGAITGAKIASDTITARCLAAGAVTTDKVSANFGAALDLSSNRTVRITSGVQSGSAGGKTVVSVTPQDGLRVNQSALGTYFQAGALGFGLYREDGTPLAEAGLDGNESYFAVRELRDATLDGALKVLIGADAALDAHGGSGLAIYRAGGLRGGLYSELDDGGLHRLILRGCDKGGMLLRAMEGPIQLMASKGAKDAGIILSPDDGNVAGYGQMFIYGTALPGADGLYMGSSAYPWGRVYVKGGSVHASDGRKKADVGAIEGAGRLIEALEPVRYRFQDQAGVHYGFVAQQVKRAMEQAGIDEWAGYDDSDPDNLGLCYEEFIAPLVTVVQAQAKALRALAARVARLEGSTC